MSDSEWESEFESAEEETHHNAQKLTRCNNIKGSFSNRRKSVTTTVPAQRMVRSVSTMSDDGRGLERVSAEKRAHHNALERKRRDHIKDSFTSLRESLPKLRNGKMVSRAQILKAATDYIMLTRAQNFVRQSNLDKLKRQNDLLEMQVLESEFNCGKY